MHDLSLLAPLPSTESDVSGAFRELAAVPALKPRAQAPHLTDKSTWIIRDALLTYAFGLECGERVEKRSGSYWRK